MVRQSIASLLCVLLALPGCASIRPSQRSGVPVQTVPASADPSMMAEYVRKLPTGSRVRVDTAQGRTLHATLMAAAEDRITIQRHTRLPVPPENIPMTDIARVTVEQPSSGNKFMAIGAAIGAGAAVGVVWLIAVLAFGD
jgi:hypothetical protein